MNQASSPTELGHLELEWEFEADGEITTSIVAASGIGIFATSEGTVYDLNVTDGSELWNVSIGSSLYSTPVLDLENEAVYVCDSSGKVTGLAIHDGTIIWQWDTGTGREIRSSPLVADKIYFGSYDSYLYALNRNGTLAWRFEGCLGWVHTSPAYYEGLVYFGSCDGYMRALDASTGKEVWNFSSAYIPSSPVVYDGKVFFGAYDSNLHCLDALNGTPVWNTTMGDNIYSSPAVDGKNVVVGCNDGNLYCLDMNDGHIVWTLDLMPSNLESSPLISGNKTAVTYDQGLVIVHLDNGTISQGFLWGNSADISPSAYDEMLFFGDKQGYVHCLQNRGQVPDDDKDDEKEMNEEVDPGWEAVFLLIALLAIMFTAMFLFLRRSRWIRK